MDGYSVFISSQSHLSFYRREVYVPNCDKISYVIHYEWYFSHHMHTEQEHR